MALEAVMGATPASMATSRKVMAPLLRRERLGRSLSGMGSLASWHMVALSLRL